MGKENRACPDDRQPSLHVGPPKIDVEKGGTAMCHFCNLATQMLGIQVVHGSPAQKFIQEAEEKEREYNVQALKSLLASRPELNEAQTPYRESDFTRIWSD